MKQINVKEYFKPKTLDEAVSMFNEYKGVISIIAGGTDLMADNHSDIKALLDIDELGLNYIEKEDGYLKIGSATTFTELLESKELYANFRGLWDSCEVLADKSIRNIATIGGNICSSVPSGDSIPPLFVMGATLAIQTPTGDLTVNIGDFFTGPRENILKKGQILKEILIPYNEDKGDSVFEKVSRNSVDLAISSVAVLVSVDNNKNINKARIALGAVAPIVVKVTKLEEVLAGTKAEEDVLNKHIDLIDEVISPISDVRSSADYREKISKVMVKRAIIEAYERAVEKI